MTPEREQEIRDRYRKAAHRMQSGVATDQATGSNDGSPKHLRVGINSSMVNHDAMARLLIAKGVIGEEEYYVAIAEAMEREADRYEQLLGVMLG